MNEKLKVAFDQVQAENELKRNTWEYIEKRTKGYTQRKRVNYREMAVGFVCMLFLVLGGQWLYFTPTVEISIDINPSMELGVNRFDRVISLKGYNDDGRELVKNLDVKFMDASEAVNRIIESENVSELLSKDETMIIAVVGKDDVQSEVLFSNMQNCTVGRDNAYCYYAHSDEVEKAHEVGLSYGKYHALQELQELNPEVTAEDVQNMKMHEIHEQIDRLSNSGECETDISGNEAVHHEEENRYHENMSGKQGSGNGNRGNAGSEQGHEKRNHGNADNEQRSGNGSRENVDTEQWNGNENGTQENGNGSHTNENSSHHQEKESSHRGNGE